jgi:hypothetical protein
MAVAVDFAPPRKARDALHTWKVCDASRNAVNGQNQRNTLGNGLFLVIAALQLIYYASSMASSLSPCNHLKIASSHGRDIWATRR